MRGQTLKYAAKINREFCSKIEETAQNAMETNMYVASDHCRGHMSVLLQLGQLCEAMFKLFALITMVFPNLNLRRFHKFSI